MLNINPYAQGAVYICRIHADGSNLALYKKNRPVVILNAINIEANVVVVAPTTTQPNINGVKVRIEDGVDSTIVLEKAFPIHVNYLERFIGIIDTDTLNEIFYAMDILYGRKSDVPQEDIDKYFPNRCEFSVKFSSKTATKPETDASNVVELQTEQSTPILKTSPKELIKTSTKEPIKTIPKDEPQTNNMFGHIKRTTFNEILSIVKKIKPAKYTDVINNPQYTIMLSRMNAFEKENHEIIINGIMNNLTINDIYDVIKDKKAIVKPDEKRKPVVYTIPAVDEPVEVKKRKYVKINLDDMSNNELEWIYSASPKDIVKRYNVSLATASRHKNRSHELLMTRKNKKSVTV